MLKAGIVGLPNVGKSTLFNALTRTRNAESANYPFCTIDPNVGVVSVPDSRLAALQAIAKTQDHPIILHRVRIGEGGQIIGANGAARIVDEFCVQRQLCATRFFDRRYFRALPVGAQKVVSDC